MYPLPLGIISPFMLGVTEAEFKKCRPLTPN
uniref:Uncharacterized protein n=1 Tax=Rubinisphaera brasiliensis (strain ATCC 49424 / DSM 5305 / JCM 21570 / IAM 15109 / NBRC 103401 / IFAM 1448) TaxID=756272 RepID=F0SP57_RUBBR|nr:hypothetical protein Plabr_3563 [Rubinisphaera brasiliensis DSM 5305]